ncbi:MAG TPA: VWA domain-containing protein [Terriglobales bacterium]|nr:VWA domain-containing protein [Terriglobales bacterium]
MFPNKAIRGFYRSASKFAAAALVLCLAVGLVAIASPAQSTPQGQTPTQSAPAQAPQTQVPEAGGPQGDVGPIVIPKKKDAPPEPRPQAPKKVEGMPDFSIRKDVPLVTVPVLVLTKNGQFVPGLKKENFKVLEDGVVQKVANFSQTSEAPITAVLLIEFANIQYDFYYDAMMASYTFADSLKPEDWIAVVSFDMKPRVIADFTQDKRAVYGALNQLRIPGFRETNVYDALYDTLDRLEGVEGRKYIILISRGIDTFSKLNYDQILKKIQATRDVTIFSISTGEAFRLWMEAHYGGHPEYGMYNMNYLQADNQMNTFSKLTGGRWYKPRFEGELPDIFRDIAASIRNQYALAYTPSNSKQDGTFRKLKVELQAADGGPLTIKDQKGKDLKVNVLSRDGYRSKHEVE